VFLPFGGRKSFFGIVETVRCHEDNSLVKTVLDSPGWVDGAIGRTAKVLVVAGGGSLRRALVGGNIAAAATRNEWAGVVVDGCVRDVVELAQLPIGISALASMPMPTEKRNEGQAGIAVQIQGVWVRPGDWLYADEDGIVVGSRPLA
jgi:regulator of ribonuclease activity A